MIQGSLETLRPQLSGVAHLLGVGRLLEIKACSFRMFLLISNVIPLCFAFAWIYDVVELECLAPTPWTEEILGGHVCLFHSFGGLFMLFMFLISGKAFACYDEDGDKLMNHLHDMHLKLKEQIHSSLADTEAQVGTLTDMLSKDLNDNARALVLDMQTILLRATKSDDKNVSSGLHKELLTSMARQLDIIREPAMSILSSSLKKQQQHSMLDLLTDNKEATGCGILRWAKGYCYTPLQAESPEKIVLSPLTKVLDQHKTLRKKHSAPPSVQADVEANVSVQVGAVEAPASDQAGVAALDCSLRTSWERLWSVVCESRLGKEILLGLLLSMIFFFFEFNMLLVVGALIQKNSAECSGWNRWRCISSFVHEIFSTIGMFIYMVSLAVVLFNVESVDRVYQARVEVKELDEIQEEVNKFSIKEGTSSMSNLCRLIQSVQSMLKDQRYITDFARELANLPTVPVEKYVELRDDLASRCNETWAATSIRRLTGNARSLSNTSELLELQPLTGRASRGCHIM